MRTTTTLDQSSVTATIASLDGGNSGIHVLWPDISTEHEAASHVLSVTRVALHHRCCWLKHGHGDISNRELFVVSLLCRNDWSVTGKHEADTWVWHKIGLELAVKDEMSCAMRRFKFV